jgi:NADH pyrophosphatase NudC (nudix superfamily)
MHVHSRYAHVAAYRWNAVPGIQLRLATYDHGVSERAAAESLESTYAVPRIPGSASAMIWSRSGRLLILKPTYKGGWTLPGGVIEADGESPWEACRRETREECGLDIGAGRSVCVDF